MGERGTWYAAYPWPERFATIVLICEFVGFAASARAVFGTLPPAQLEIQAADDPVVSVKAARRMVAALQAVGANAQYTECEGGHNA